ncbi:PspC domain-containing protein [Streptomyces sp. NPDC057638]|uniref:PspC domain-containing protein n=1 Tax=Streptomyces sp. NPDC057638 TaxID=3346190 RepID=UPI0036CF23F3
MTSPASPAGPANPASPAGPATAPPTPVPPAEEERVLRRAHRQKVLGGVCGGLGRYFDMDPVIFRIVLGVLGVTGGVGLIFYGFAWLLIPLDDEEEPEARKLLAGRVDGAALTALFLALIGCALFLTMLNSDGALSFTALVALATCGVAVWSRRRRAVTPERGGLAPAAAHAVAEAPPEPTAPPVPDGPSWWRDPLTKEAKDARDARGALNIMAIRGDESRRMGPAGPHVSGYLWGPESALTRDDDPKGRDRAGTPRRQRQGRSLGGYAFVLALVAGFLGTRLSWESQPLGTSLQIGLVCALGVFGTALVISSFIGRTGFGTVVMTALTAVFLAGATALPKDIDTAWARTTWAPTATSDLKPHYELGSGIATLDVSDLTVPAGGKVSTYAEVGAGKLTVVLPKDTRVTLRAEAGVGDITFPGDGKERQVRISTDRTERRTLPAPQGAAPSGTLELRLEVGLGQVEVTRAAS